MNGFDSRPPGTVIHGAFRTYASAKRALRVLKNAGYLRSEVDPVADDSGKLPAVVTVDAAATGAVRAAEILAEHGAELHYATGATVRVPVHVEAPLPAEPNPRIRKRSRLKALVPVESPARQDVLIKTRGSDVMPLDD